MWYVYIIQSVNSKYKYIGSTGNLKRRIKEHNEGICKATNSYKPFEICSYIAVKSKAKAIELEKYLKTGSGKAFLKKRVF